MMGSSRTRGPYGWALAASFVVAILFNTPTHAQTLYGAIVGNVTDAAGAVAPGVTLTATNTGTGLKVETVTDADGAYAFDGLVPNEYKVTVEGKQEYVTVGDDTEHAIELTP